MRYRLEFCPNPDVVIVHIDKQVVKSIQAWHSPDFDTETQPRLARDLFNVEGIVSVSISPYHMQIEKGGVFEWNEMTSAILHCIQINLEPSGELVETKPPTKTSLDRLGCAHEVPLIIQKPRKKRKTNSVTSDKQGDKPSQ